MQATPDAPETLTEGVSQPIATVAANNVAQAVSHVNANAGEYTLLLSQDVTVLAEQHLNVGNRKLTIIGIGGEQKITRTGTANGRTFLVGASNQTGIELTIGNNITLQGRTANNNAVVTVQNGAAFKIGRAHV